MLQKYKFKAEHGYRNGVKLLMGNADCLTSKEDKPLYL